MRAARPQISRSLSDRSWSRCRAKRTRSMFLTGCEREFGKGNELHSSSPVTRPACKAARRASHALVPGFARPPAHFQYRPRRGRASNVCSDVQKRALVPRKSRSRMCKAPTLSFSKARKASSIDSSSDLRSVGSVQRSIARGWVRTRDGVDGLCQRFLDKLALMLLAYVIWRASDVEARADELPLAAQQTGTRHRKSKV